MNLPINKVTSIVRLIRKFNITSTVPLAILILSLIDSSIGEFLWSITILKIVFPLSFICRSICPQRSLTMTFSILKCSNIYTILIRKSSLTMKYIILKCSLISPTIIHYQYSPTMHHVSQHLSMISSTINYLPWTTRLIIIFLSTI